MLFAAFRVGASRHGAAGAPQGCPGSGSDLGTAVSTASLASPKSPWGRGGLVGARRCLHGPGEPLEGAARVVHSLKIALLQQDYCEGLFQLKKEHFCRVSCSSSECWWHDPGWQLCWRSIPMSPITAALCFHKCLVSGLLPEAPLPLF